uniref:Uncharacterized protein n=1 Tax=Anas platyrhynchos platyrhynchos TaxID=8840 RepID=A0A493U0Z3_ANAPP
MLVLASVSEHDPFIDFYKPFYRLTLYILQPKIRIPELNLHCQPSSLQKKEMTYNKIFKENNYFNRQLINKIEVMLMKGNTNYLSDKLKIFL